MPPDGILWLCQVTGWGYADVMGMDLDELGWWIEQALHLEERKAEAQRRAVDGSRR